MTSSHQRGTRRLLECALVLLFACCLPLLARAGEPEPSTAIPPEYAQVIEDAVREYRRMHFPEARALFSRANELYPNARSLRGIGMTEFELRNYVESAVALRRSLACPIKSLAGELRERTEQLLKRAEEFVARYEIESDAAELTVSVDGVPAGLEGSGLTLQVGDHRVEFSASGYPAQGRELHVKGGEHETLSIRFAHAARTRPMEEPSQGERPTVLRSLEDPQTPVVPRADSHADKPLYKRAWLWAAVGGVVAAAAVGLTFGLRARSAETRDPIAEWPVATLPGP